MDRIANILYQLPMTRTRKGRTLSMAVAGSVIAFGLLHAGKGLAEPSIPVPSPKPGLISPADLPVPAAKPLPPGAHRVALADKAPVPAKKPVLQFKPAHSGPLSAKQAGLYAEIFNLQEAGHISKASKEIAKLDNGLLMGHVLAQKFLHPAAYRSSFAELENWLENYSDHPQADKIYKLAVSRKPDNYKGRLKQPKRSRTISGNLGSISARGLPYQSSRKRSGAETAQLSALKRQISRHVDKYEPTQALKKLKASSLTLDNAERDEMLAAIAAGYFYAGKLDQAEDLSSSALKRSGKYVPQAGWINGLVNWQAGDYRQAARAFETAASSPYASGWMVSAAAYWASRANMRAGSARKVSEWLEISASYPRTFYGLIATRALGRDFDFDWRIPAFTQKHLKFIESEKAGLRALGLIAANQIALAEDEIQKIGIGRDLSKKEAVLAFASHYKLPSLTLKLGNAIPDENGMAFDAALYPLMPWEPKGGYRVDRALIHALIRQESRFNVAAESPSGAMGLMQLMPSTASYVAGNRKYNDSSGQHFLRDPELNLQIGQKYIERLLNHPAVGQDLMSMAVAYNAGPGKLSRWKRERTHIRDPLMFIESIPYAETRAFVERVMSNYWIYRLRLEQETPSLEAVAQGKWARYAAQDDGSVKFAAR